VRLAAEQLRVELLHRHAAEAVGLFEVVLDEGAVLRLGDGHRVLKPKARRLVGH